LDPYGNGTFSMDTSHGFKETNPTELKHLPMQRAPEICATPLNNYAARSL
jgi:hypothetical protein